MTKKSPKSGSEDLAALLRRRREELGLSRRDLADLAHLSYPYVSQLETGYRLPSARATQALAQALELPASLLFDTLGDVVPLRTDTTASTPAPPPSAPLSPERGAWIPNPAAPPEPSAPPAAQRASSTPRSPQNPTRLTRAPGTTRAAVRAAIELLTTIEPSERLSALNEVQSAVVASLVDHDRPFR